MFLLPYAGFIFAAASLPVGAEIVGESRRYLVPVSLVCALIYGWLSAVERMAPFDLSVIVFAAVPAFFAYLAFVFLLDKYSESLAVWFGIYIAALLLFLLLL